MERAQVDAALTHPVALIANALGSPPDDVIASAHDRGIAVAALADRAEHAARYVGRGVDTVVAQGYEAGGHTGEIASMVLIRGGGCGPLPLPMPLPMPLQNLLVSEAHQRLMRSGDPDVVPMPVGQMVGRTNAVRPVAQVMASLLAELDETLGRLAKLR